MPYSPPSSAFTAVDVPHFSRPTQGNLPSSSQATAAPRRSRNPSASMLNFSTERGPGAHKPLRGLPRRVKPASRPVSVDITGSTAPDASIPRSMTVAPPLAAPQARSRGRAKFSVGDDDSSESTSGSPKGSPSTEHGPTAIADELDRASQSDSTPTPTPQPSTWTAGSPRASPSIAKTLSIDTSASYPSRADEQSEKTVPFPMFSPEPVRTEPPTRLPAMIPLGALSHFASSFANGNNDVENPSPMIRSASSSMISPASTPGLLPANTQKSLNGGHGRSASLADVGRFTPGDSGACTPIIRKSNGQPLKPSLKSSLSSPNIASMSGPRPIAKSAPATPRVHFKELGLESVVLFDKGARPVAVSGEYGGADDTETETEQENGRGFPFPRVPAGSALVRLAPTTTKLAFQPPPQSHVHLQYLTLPPVRPPRLHGTILVRNVAFGKSVVVRYTTDNWETASEILATYSASLPPGIVPGGGDAPWDKFTFIIKLDDIERNLPNRTLFCVVRYDAHGVGEWWDNNSGQNYRVDFERPAGSNGEAISKSNTSGDQSSAPSDAFTYSSGSVAAPPAPAPPAPFTKPRSYSTSVVAPPAPIKMSAPAHGGPIPHQLHLRLSNYVSPTMNAAKAPLPGKPFQRQEERERSSFSPPSSPEQAKAPLPTNDLGVDFQDEAVFTPSPAVTPLKMPATLTPPDSVDNSPSPSPPMKRLPLLPQSQPNGLLSPSSSPSTSMLLTSPSSPSQDDAAAAEMVAKTMELKDDEVPMSPSSALLDQVINRFCFHQSSPGGTPTGSPYSASSGSLLGALGMSNGYPVSSPKSSPRGGSPAGSGANSPATTTRNGLPRGGSFVLGTPGTAGSAFTKRNPPSSLAGL